MKTNEELIRDLKVILNSVPRSLRNIPVIGAEWNSESDAVKEHWRDEADLMALRVEDALSKVIKILSAS